MPQLRRIIHSSKARRDGGRREVFLPTKPLLMVQRAPDLKRAKRIVYYATKGRVQMRGTGWVYAHWDSQAGAWWMITED